MSTIDEVLAAAEVVDAVCVIDGETRIISVPNEYKELGVESDEKVTRVKFQCPKIVGDNIDLTECNLYINYKNAGNKLNSYLVEDVTVTGDTINFSWLLSRHVTESPGTISYIVCAKKSDDTGVINEWNTKVATGTVGIGLEATEEIEEQNIDAIEQILRSIVELENNIGGGGSGEDGGYYAPAVDAAGNLSWTASKADMPAVDGANIKGPQGKSAYQYAVDGGYTGTEAEFAAKLAEEIPDKLPNPNALTFTGAVTGSYDGSDAVTVEIPSGGGSGSAENWRLVNTVTTAEDVSDIRITQDSDGNPLSLKKVKIFVKVRGNSSNLSAWCRVTVNNLTGSLYSDLQNTFNATEGQDYYNRARIDFSVCSGRLMLDLLLRSLNNAASKNTLYLMANTGVFENYPDVVDTITSIRMWSASAGIGAGTEIQVYGVDA